MEVVIKYPGDDALKGVPTPTEVISESESVKSGKATCEVITGPECLLDILPSELLDLIASFDEPSYKALVRSYPRFARSVSPGVCIDFMIAFGHDIHCTKNYTIRTKHSRLHSLSHPARHWFSGTQTWFRNGLQHRFGAPAVIAGSRREWFSNGKMHRNEGPARYYVDDDTSARYFEHGLEVSEQYIRTKMHARMHTRTRK